MDARIRQLIDLIPELRGRDVAIEPLTGGITNRNYSLSTRRDRFVLRLAGDNSELLGIDRAVEHASARAAFDAGVGPEVVAFWPGDRAMITRFAEGKVLGDDDVRRPEVLAPLVASLRRYHQGPGGGGSFSAFATVRRYHELARRHGVEFPGELATALGIMDAIEEKVGRPARVVPCHNDLLPANFVHGPDRVWILDWEYAGVGDVFFDLANLAANSRFGEAEERLLLQLYFGREDAGDLERLRLMRLASDFREALWGFLQLGVSRLDFDYRSYAQLYLGRFLEAANSKTTCCPP